MFDFTYRSYEALLRFVRDDLGRPIVPLRDAPADGPCVILRHDIDCSLPKALAMARLEHRLGVRASYFVLLTSEYYNLMMPANRAIVREIAAMEHEIGLHYDTTDLPGDTPDAQAGIVVRQARFLEEYVGRPVVSVAQHNPSLTAVRLSIPGYVDAYAPRFFKEIGYLSDSRRIFGAPDLQQFFRTHARSQLLIHPLWYHDRSLGRREAFDAIRAEADGAVSRYLDAMAAEMDEYELRLSR